MNQVDTTAVRVRVCDYELRPLPRAAVALKNRTSRDRHKLTFDRSLGTFTASGVPPGDYVVRATSRGLEGAEHSLRVEATGAEDSLILGKAGMPAYYLGGVRVPCDPSRDLVALTLDGARVKEGGQPERDVINVAIELGLREEPAAATIREANVLVFRLTRPDSLDEVVERLNELPAVRRAGPVLHLRPDSVTYLTNELVVRFAGHVEIDEVDVLAREHGLSVVRTLPYAGNAFVLAARRPSLALLDTCERLARSELVEYAEPNLVTTAVPDFTPNDPLYDNQPHHAILGSEGAWDVTLGDSSITIAVMDNGCDINHPDFVNPAGAGWTKIVNPFDFMSYDTDPTAGSHGTKSCGIAAAVSNNGRGVAGMASGCRLMPLRYPNGGSLTEWSDAYIWAAGFNPSSNTLGFPTQISAGADVISNSFGLSEAALPGIMKDTFDFLTTYGRGGKGCVVVFSVGNDNADFTADRQWAAYDKTMAVASSRISPPDAAEVKVSTSNFGAKVDVCAPGGGRAGSGEARTMSTTNVGIGTTAGTSGGMDFDYDTYGQTSCACPQVSGTAALMLSANPPLTWTQVRALLRSTAVKIDAANTDPTAQWIDTDGDGVADFSQWYGYGRINAAAAVNAARNYGLPYELVVRENLADTGAVRSYGPFWDSPDVWVRRLSPALDGVAALPADYMTAGPHEIALPLQDNWIYVRVRDNGPGVSLPFSIRVYLAHFAGTEFVYPTDFIPTNRPGTTPTTPLQHGTYLIGEVAHGPLAAGEADIVKVRWPAALVPPQTVVVSGVPTAWHPCLLVEVSPHDGLTPTGNHVWDNNNLAQKNISIDYVSDDDFASFFVLGNGENSAQELVLCVERGKLPPDARLWLRFIDPDTHARVLQAVREGSQANKGLRLSFFKPGGIQIEHPDEDWAVALDVPTGTTMNFVRRTAVLSRTSVSFLELDPVRDVIHLPAHPRVEIPVPVRRGERVGVIVGGHVPQWMPEGRYQIVLTQLGPERELSGAASVEVRIGEKGDQAMLAQ